MDGRILLDTNIVIDLFAGDEGIKDRLGRAEEVFVPAVVLGELYYGAQRSSRAQTNLAKIDDFAARSAVLPVDFVTAQKYGLIKDKLRKMGQPIPENDLWVAAIAVQHDLTLISRDGHFEAISDLVLERW